MAELAALEGMRQCVTELDKYVYLRRLQEKTPSLFYKVLINNAQELLPIVYTPGVGAACENYSKLPIAMQGIVISTADKGKILEKLKTQWPEETVRVVVVTDGERILGLGDLGFNGMGISEGKILLYTVIAGVNPSLCLPVCIDVGTNNEELLNDPTYKGLRQRRLRGPEYDELIDEFVLALREWQPHLLLQFEDFGNANAFRLLDKYADQHCCFNDDIQGTACIALAGLLSALRITGKPLVEQRIVFYGAGEAGTGIGQLIANAMVHEYASAGKFTCSGNFSKAMVNGNSDIPLTLEKAREKLYYIDSKGLVCKSRSGLQHHKLPFAHDVPFQPDLISAVKELKPTMLVGVSTMPGAFTKEVLEIMAEMNDRPIIFPLSNPTSKSECTYDDAFKWTNGKLVFASGSPFPGLTADNGKVYFPAQANNAYIFGPIGMAAVLTKCKKITDEVFLETARILASMTPPGTLDSGMLFPTFTDMKKLAPILIAKVAEVMVESGLGSQPAGVHDWTEYVKSQMYQPKVYGRALSVKVSTVPVPEVHHEEMQELIMLRQMYTDIQRYLFLRHLQDDSPKVFWKLIMDNAQELLPYVYTPTVGEACEKYSSLHIMTRGLYLTAADSGKILDKLKAWPNQDIQVIVVTDGERILGLGDLGAGGMGISEGKIILYTVIAGVDPAKCLPVCFDVGTENKLLLEDHEYKGLRQRRLRGPPYDSLLDEFMSSLRQWRSHVLLQFEDFGNQNAFRLLEKYQEVQCCFNDDIQGTACICLAGLLSALRVTGRNLEEQRIIFLGAGEAGTGIGKLISLALHKLCGIPYEEALKACFYIDSKGLVCRSRKDLQHHKQLFAHDVPFQPDLLSAVKVLKPTMLIGVSTMTGAFTPEVLADMASINDRPIVFPLSNPTSKSECTFEEAYQYTSGRVVFASGSPFPPYTTNDERTLFPAQANNAYIFGPIGMAAVLTKCKTITDDVFLETAECLAKKTPEARLASGMLFPAFSDMTEVSPQLIADIAEFMVNEGLGSCPDGVTNWVEYVKSQMFKPDLVSAI